MKKSILFYLFAVVCTVCLFTACSDDDDNDKKSLTIDTIVGTYPGAMDISMAGNPVANDLETSIKVAKAADDKVTVSLSNFSIPGVLPTPIDINADCAVTSSSDKLKLAGATSITITGLGNLDVTLAGEADGSKLDLKITVPMAGVVVDFSGKK